MRYDQRGSRVATGRSDLKCGYKKVEDSAPTFFGGGNSYFSTRLRLATGRRKFGCGFGCGLRRAKVRFDNLKPKKKRPRRGRFPKSPLPRATRRSLKFNVSRFPGARQRGRGRQPGEHPSHEASLSPSSLRRAP